MANLKSLLDKALADDFDPITQYIRRTSFTTAQVSFCSIRGYSGGSGDPCGERKTDFCWCPESLLISPNRNVGCWSSRPQVYVVVCGALFQVQVHTQD